jgi:hypothetical protein
MMRGERGEEKRDEWRNVEGRRDKFGRIER